MSDDIRKLANLSNALWVDAEDELEELRATIATLRKALDRISKQKLRSEIPDAGMEEWGDFEDAFDQCVLLARAALQGEKKAPGVDVEQDAKEFAEWFSKQEEKTDEND